MLILIEPRSFWKNREVEMKSSDPREFALDVGRGTLVCLLPAGSVGVKIMQSQRHALERTKGSDPVELFGWLVGFPFSRSRGGDGG